MVDETRLSRKALSPESRPNGSGNAGCRRTGLGPRFICGLPVLLACTLHVSSLSGGQLTEPEHHARTSTSDRAPHAEDLLIGAVLPLSGPPALSSFADLIRQGVELAVAVRNDRGADIELLIRDYRAEPLTASIHTRELELQGADGMVGYLEEAALRAAAGYGVRVPLVSPTARNADAAGRWAYSLEGPDPISARKMARFAREEGYDRVAVLHEGAPASYAEARAFVDEADRIGLPVMTVVSQESGAPHFADQLSTLVTALRSEEIMALGLEEDDTLDVSLLDPVAAYITVPAETLELLAPQFTHFGLDTLGIDILGNAAWTHPATLSLVDDRHTTGVFAPTGSLEDGANEEAFRRLYESHFERTLLSSVPALGFDAVLVLLGAIESSGRSSVEIPGATGLFTFEEGRVLRRTRIVEIREGALIEPGSMVLDPDTLLAPVVDTMRGNPPAAPRPHLR